jgi:replication-associated recombination protein RarA
MREKMGDRQLNSLEQENFDKMRQLMKIVNTDKTITQEAKDLFTEAMNADKEVMQALQNKWIMTDEEYQRFFNMIFILIKSIKGIN